MMIPRVIAAALLAGACVATYAAEPPGSVPVTQTTREERMAAALQDYQAQKANPSTPSPSMRPQQPPMKHHHRGHAMHEGMAASAPK